MLVEAAVLDGENRLAHAIGNHGERDGAPLLALAAGERRQHRRVEDQPFAWLSTQLELQDVIGDRGRGGGFVGAARLCRATGAGGRSKTTRTICPLKLGDARHDADLAGADGELARLLDVLAVRVPEIVQPVDQLLSVSAWPRRSSSGRAKTRGSVVSRSPWSRASIRRREGDG